LWFCSWSLVRSTDNYKYNGSGRVAGYSVQSIEYVRHFKLVNTSLGCEGGVPSSLRGPGLRADAVNQVWPSDHLGVKVNRACDGCPEPLITHLGVAVYRRKKRGERNLGGRFRCSSWRLKNL
jgi:hypothetical protein